MYASIRESRAQRVWEGSRRAGDIYEGRAGYDGIGLDELQALWDYVWNQPLDADLDCAVNVLVQLPVGTFERAAHSIVTLVTFQSM